jgi:hypothetical protein
VSALLAGCLTASFIGGTVNFFATARALKDDIVATGTITGDGGKGGSIDAVMGGAFGSMAAADLIVMALYFAALQVASRSLCLRRLFPILGTGGNDDIAWNEQQESRLQPELAKRGSGDDGGCINSSSTETSHWRGATLTAALLVSSIALASVVIATHLEWRVVGSFPPPFNPPGTMCAFLSLLGLASHRLIGYTSLHAYHIVGRPYSSLSVKVCDPLRKIPDVAPMLSDACFYLLSAAVGSAADLLSAIAGGPAAMMFATIALVVHSVTTVALSWACTILGRRSGTTLSLTSWEELLTASNAAIGGPSTAAAFAAGLIPNNSDGSDEEHMERCDQRSSLVIAATFWGVFGYAIATSIGVKVSRLLMRL